MTRPLRILFVEDVKDDIELVKATFAGEGIDTHIAEADSPASLDAALERSEFDVALIDFVLPKFGGIEAITTIRARRPSLPIVLLTGALDASALEHLPRNADAHLLKQDRARLPSLVKTLIERGRTPL